jgi:hypothetical protein
MLLPRFCCIEVTHKNDRSGLVLRYMREIHCELGWCNVQKNDRISLREPAADEC